jgi:hypothetical protein
MVKILFQFQFRIWVAVLLWLAFKVVRLSCRNDKFVEDVGGTERKSFGTGSLTTDLVNVCDLWTQSYKKIQ